MVSSVLRMLVPFSLMFTVRMPLVLAVFRLALTELIVKAYGARHVTLAVPVVMAVVSSDSEYKLGGHVCYICRRKSEHGLDLSYGEVDRVRGAKGVVALDRALRALSLISRW